MDAQFYGGVQTTLNFRGKGKTKQWLVIFCKRTLDIEFERDVPIGLGATFGDDHIDRQAHKHTKIFS